MERRTACADFASNNNVTAFNALTRTAGDDASDDRSSKSNFQETKG